MKILYFLVVCLSSLSAFAQEDAFVQENEVLGNISEPVKPTCQNADFQHKAFETIAGYLDSKEVKNTIEKRHKALVLKGLNALEPVEISTVKPEENYRLANALMMIKINLQVEEKDILICKQELIGQTPVYIVSYPYLDNFRAHVINLDPQVTDYQTISFIYP